MFRQNEKLSCETSSDYRTSIHYSSSTGSLKRQLQKRNSKSNSLSMVMLRRIELKILQCSDFQPVWMWSVIFNERLLYT
ncbi:hypothetical protein LINPERPRIM_LOCUS26817 [Linum perenne]